MATSGTYAFTPTAGDIILQAFSMIQVRRWEITQQHLIDAAFQAQLLMVDFSNRNPNRWGMETQEVELQPDVPTYDLTNRTLSIAIAYISTSTGSATVDRVIGPLSAADYAAIPNKLQTAPPVAFFFSLLSPTPTVTVWPTPDDATTYTLKMQTFRQMQDVVVPGGANVDAPYRFLDAVVKGLAARLAALYPEKLRDPAAAARLDAAYLAAFDLAAAQEQERLPMMVLPELSSYYR